MDIYLQMKYKIFLRFFLISLLVPCAANAYAGPGVAIGAVIVALTVIITFFASTILSIFKLFKKFFNSKNKKKQSSSKKKIKKVKE